jgi:hypothetical protein
MVGPVAGASVRHSCAYPSSKHACRDARAAADRGVPDARANANRAHRPGARWYCSSHPGHPARRRPGLSFVAFASRGRRGALSDVVAIASNLCLLRKQGGSVRSCVGEVDRSYTSTPVGHFVPQRTIVTSGVGAPRASGSA